MAMTQTQGQVAKLIARAIVETVREAGPRGAPCNMVYLAFQSHGMGIEVYENFVQTLVGLGVLKKENHTLTMGDEQVASKLGF